MNGIRWYETVNEFVGSRDGNADMAIFHLQCGWLGALVAKNLQLPLYFPEWTGPNQKTVKAGDTRFLVTGLVFEKRIDLPYRKARLWLHGRVYDEDVYAIADVLIDRPDKSWSITFSPVPFGFDGKPMLPYNSMVELQEFLVLAKFILLLPEKSFTREKIVSLMDSMPHKMRFGASAPERATHFLQTFVRLGVIESTSTVDYNIKMLPQEFENIFGKKLPFLP